MTVGFAGIVEVGTGIPCLKTLSETLLSFKNARLNVQNTFELR